MFLSVVLSKKLISTEFLVHRWCIYLHNKPLLLSILETQAAFKSLSFVSMSTKPIPPSSILPMIVFLLIRSVFSQTKLHSSLVIFFIYSPLGIGSIYAL